jgi:hypothetical protein
VEVLKTGQAVYVEAAGQTARQEHEDRNGSEEKGEATQISFLIFI